MPDVRVWLAVVAVAAGLSSPAAAQTLFGGGVFGADGLALTKADIELLNKTVRTALDTLPNGQAEEWANPETGSHGTVIPVNRYQSGGMDCRTFDLYITPRNQPNTRHFRVPACKVADGSWKLAF